MTYAPPLLVFLIVGAGATNGRVTRRGRGERRDLTTRGDPFFGAKPVRWLGKEKRKDRRCESGNWDTTTTSDTTLANLWLRVESGIWNLVECRSIVLDPLQLYLRKYV